MVSGNIPLSFTSPEETFHGRSTDMSITLNEPMHCYIQYLLSGQVPTLEYGKPIGHVLNEISNTTWYNQLANIRYNSLATKHQQMKNATTVHHTKTTVQPCIIIQYNYLLRLVLTTWKNPLLPPWKTLSDAQARLCVDQVFKLFAHVPLFIKNIISWHLICMV